MWLGRPTTSAGGSTALQPGAVGLPRSQQWELVELLDLLGRLESRHAAAGEPAPAFLEVEGRTGDDEGGHPFAHERIRVADGHGVMDVRMGLERGLDLRGRDVLPAAD